MTLIDKSSPEPIHPHMTLLEVMYQWRSSEAVFQAYEAQAGTCLRCHALFDTLEAAAQKYNLDLSKLLADLNVLACRQDSGQDKQP